MKAEWESSKLAHEATRAEFESYKVRLAQRLVFNKHSTNTRTRTCLVTLQHFSDRTRVYLVLGDRIITLSGTRCIEDIICCATKKLFKNNDPVWLFDGFLSPSTS